MKGTSKIKRSLKSKPTWDQVKHLSIYTAVLLCHRILLLQENNVSKLNLFIFVRIKTFSSVVQGQIQFRSHTVMECILYQKHRGWWWTPTGQYGEPQQRTQVVLWEEFPRLSVRVQTECQLCEQRYAHIIPCRFAAETRPTQADKHWLIRQDFCQRAKVFPHIRGENKHSQLRKQTPKHETTNNESNPRSALPCLYEMFLSLFHTQTHTHSRLVLRRWRHHLWPPCSLWGLITHTAPLPRGLSLTVMWPLLTVVPTSETP